jgi:hypothetical protein
LGEAPKGLNPKVERSHRKTIQICYREKAMLICRKEKTILKNKRKRVRRKKFEI